MRYLFVLVLVILGLRIHAQKPDSISSEKDIKIQLKKAQEIPQFELLVSTAGFASAWTNNGLYKGIRFWEPVFGPWVIPSAELGAIVQFNPILGKNQNRLLFIRSGLLVYHAIGNYYLKAVSGPVSGIPDSFGADSFGFHRSNNIAIPLYIGAQFTLRNIPAFAYFGTEVITPPRWMNKELLYVFNQCKTCPILGFPYSLNLKAAIGVQPRKKLLHSMDLFIEQTYWKPHILNIGFDFTLRIFSHG